MKLELATVPIEVRAFKSISEEIRFLLSKNATRTKTVFQKVREGQEWQEIETANAAARKRATQNNEAARADRKNFSYQAEIGKVSDIIARRVGLGSGVTYSKAVKVVEEIDRLIANDQTEIAFAYKEILNRPSVDGAYKLLSQPQSERERILEIFSENKALSLKEAIKLLKDLNPPPETEVQLAEGMRVVVDRASPICPGLKGEITSLPNSSSAIVFFEDGTRQMVDLGYIKPALENLPQSLIDRVNQKPRSTTPETPKQNKVYNNRGLLYNELKEYQKALSDYERAIALNSESAIVYRVYNNRGVVYERLKEYQKAILEYDRAIVLNPQSANVYRNRAKSHIQLGNILKAIEDLQIASKLYSQQGKLTEYQKTIDLLQTIKSIKQS